MNKILENKVQIRKATGDVMLTLWGYEDVYTASPTAKYFYRNISSGNAVFWTVENEGELIGELYAFLDIEEDRDFADGISTAYLCAFRIRKEYRGQGLGTSLMERALVDLKTAGFRYATIGVSDERNERLYRRMGFTEEKKMCYFDPCARDENMQPQPDEGYLLLSKTL
ncbi:MAG: GNAT family N-acetyltransferase [Oscillospiraceae bacterium]|nr:GNAT family N-acetyltransferase [Oscillospiraceae bacterium]